jgi:hypothetical protein
VKLPRVSVWRVCVWLMALMSWINVIRMLRQPDELRDALQFFTFWILVLAISVAVGSLVALLLVGFRRLTEDAQAHSIHRLT